MRKGRARTHFLIALCACAIFIGVLLIAPLCIPVDPNATDLSQAFRALGEEGFALGSDALGRDVLVRTIAGGSESVALGFAVIAIILVVGSLLGLAAGFFGGAVDAVISKIITAFQAFPSFVLAVAIAGILGQGLMNMVLAIAAVYWTQYARLVRSITIAFKTSTCVDAARVCGAGPAAIIRNYLVPQTLGPLAVLSAVSMSDVILTMAGLSFIGLGPARPSNEWGAMMAEAQPSFQYALWCMLVPMAALFIAVVLFNLLGDTLRDALDVRTHYAKKRSFTIRSFFMKGKVGSDDAGASDPRMKRMRA